MQFLKLTIGGVEKGIFGENGLAGAHIFDSAHYVRIGVREGSPFFDFVRYANIWAG